MNKLLLTLIALVMVGCAHDPQQSKFPALQQQLEKPRLNYTGGSLWQASSGSLVEDFKARLKGDTVTVVITETASASKSATTSTARTTALAAGVPNFMGLETNMTGISKWMDLSKLLNADTSSKYDGSGSTTRKENLNATITARVVDVLANGNLLIEGRRNVMVNHEDQIIMLEGTVRPKDISPDNVISSAQIADARITYSGKGIISDRQQPGWLMNIIDHVWPF
jgi:flagellar L-ring protein precursor FlgH